MSNNSNISEDRLKAKSNQLRPLRMFKNLPEAELRKRAIDSIQKEDEAYELLLKLSDFHERKYAKGLLQKYLKDYVNITISDKNILKDLVYFEVVQLRLQKKLNELAVKDNAIPTNLVDSLRANTEIILKLKESINLLNKEVKTDKDKLELIKKKFKIWREDNQGSRTLICPHCGKFTLLKIRTDIWESQKHPFFKDRILYNKPLIELYKTDKITKQDIADVLECSPDYVTWIIERGERK